jgi:hypothetical protein
MSMTDQVLGQSQGQPVEFHWLSPLGIAVALFLLYGLVYVLIGALTPLLKSTDPGGVTIIIISNRTDSQLFGQSPSELVRSDPAVGQLRAILLDIIGGLLFIAGLFHMAITWFGLRQGQTWALVVLAVGGIIALPFWFLALRPYLQASIALTLGDIPPFMWVPAALLIPATVLGWLGLR